VVLFDYGYVVFEVCVEVEVVDFGDRVESVGVDVYELWIFYLVWVGLGDDECW